MFGFAVAAAWHTTTWREVQLNNSFRVVHGLWLMSRQRENIWRYQNITVN
jgi:hypothetical protein